MMGCNHASRRDARSAIRWELARCNKIGAAARALRPQDGPSGGLFLHGCKQVQGRHLGRGHSGMFCGPCIGRRLTATAVRLPREPEKVHTGDQDGLRRHEEGQGAQRPDHVLLKSAAQVAAATGAALSDGWSIRAAGDDMTGVQNRSAKARCRIDSGRGDCCSASRRFSQRLLTLLLRDCRIDYVYQ